MQDMSSRGSKLKVLAALLMLTIVPATPTSAKEQEGSGKLVRVEYDSNRDFTSITMVPFVLASRKFEELRLGAITGFAGKTRVKPKEVALVFVSLSTSDMNKYVSTRKLTVTLDGERLAVGETQHSKQSQNGLFIETMPITIPMDLFLRISQAHDVTMKLGFTEIKFRPEHMHILRIAASYMTE
jgi:hypothetical protein